MKVRRELLAIALLLTTSVSGLGNVSLEEKRNRLRNLQPEARKINLSPLERAYLDSITLLRQPGACGEFFGGRDAQDPLEEMVIRIREQRLDDRRMSVRMFGSFAYFTSAEKSVAYRVFPDVELNKVGPFYKSKAFPAEPFVAHVGYFRPNTRGARILILLHELAHLIKGADGAWLIPDDGHSPELSRQNTFTVDSKCGKQIRAL